MVRRGSEGRVNRGSRGPPPLARRLYPPVPIRGFRLSFSQRLEIHPTPQQPIAAFGLTKTCRSPTELKFQSAYPLAPAGLGWWVRRNATSR